MRIITTIILFYLWVPLSLSAQVGVNKPDPEQALDVEGKVKISDDATAPSAGTIRYNDIEQDFEGHDGTEWLSFTDKSNLPEGILAVQYYEFGLSANGEWTFAEAGLNQDSGFSVDLTIPSGKIFVVDKIIVTPNTDVAGSYFVGIRQSTESGSGFNPQVFMRTQSTGGSFEKTANRSPLLVVRSGRRFQIFNSSTSPGEVRFQIYGFFVNQVSDFYGL